MKFELSNKDGPPLVFESLDTLPRLFVEVWGLAPSAAGVFARSCEGELIGGRNARFTIPGTDIEVRKLP